MFKQIIFFIFLLSFIGVSCKKKESTTSTKAFVQMMDFDVDSAYFNETNAHTVNVSLQDTVINAYCLKGNNVCVSASFDSDIAVGTYPLAVIDSIYSLVFLDYNSNLAYMPTSGELMIQEHDLINKRISGSFHGVFSIEPDLDTRIISNGVFSIEY